MNTTRKERIKFYRIYKKLVSSFDTLLFEKIISKSQHNDWMKVINSMDAEWKRQFRERNVGNFGKIGRKKNEDKFPRPTKCKKEGCNNRPAVDQVYCSAEHAPLAKYPKTKIEAIPPEGLVEDRE